jgi:hypothetical protein
MTALAKFIRGLRPVDLILPAGAALVSAGLQQLVDREQRQRDRLRALAELVDASRGALTAAGVELPAELAQDERHPLDVENAISTVLGRTPAEPDYRITGNSNPEKPRGFLPRRGWKLAGLALGAAAAVTLYTRRGDLVDAVLARAGAGLDDDPAWAPDAVCSFCTHPVGEHGPRGEHPSGPPAAAAPEPEPVDTVPPVDEPVNEADVIWCGWTGCDYNSAFPATVALHRNACVYRPAGAQVREP